MSDAQDCPPNEPAEDLGESLEVVKPRLRRFQDLFQRRVNHILLVSNLYDSFILAEDGQINEALLRQYVDLGLSHNPELTRVNTGAAAVAMAAAERRFDLIITGIHVGDIDALELTRRLRAAGLDTPVILIAYNNRELTEYASRNDLSSLERVFLWQGDFRILIAMVKCIEDRMNVAHDTGLMGVPAIIVVEDNVRYYSSFLPLIYSEITAYTHSMISEGLNLSQKMLRMRSRPKILLCTTFDEARNYFNAYEDQIMGIISDIEYPMEGRLNKRAGFDLAERVRRVRPDVPIVLQSSFLENEEQAHECGASFLLKGSPVLLHDLRGILREHFGFGTFVFRRPDASEIDRAHDLKTLIEKIKTVPAESIAFHGERNHFSMWLKARTELSLAEALRPRQVSDFKDVEHLRSELIQSISDYRRERDRIIVADFDRRAFEQGDFDASTSLSRIGGGSLGGKARGLAFINRVLSEYEVQEMFPQVSIGVPTAAVLGTDVFDYFLDQDDLRSFAIENQSDHEVATRFMGAPFPTDAVEDLRSFLKRTPHPLAVRSSGLLEDSPSQPFAGVYLTYMLPNNHPDLETRLIQLIGAIKRVYASTFSRQAKDFLRMTPFRLEEEKMAVIVQRIVGSPHGNRFYPWFSGVARSYDFYPAGPLKSEDGVAAVALGMGRTVVEGGVCLRFCPRHPLHQVAFSSVDDVLNNSQRDFWALNLDEEPGRSGVEGAELSNYPLKVAEQDGTLGTLASTYSPDNDVIYDGVSRPGVRLVSFANILKHRIFPLAELLTELLDIGSKSTGSAVEIEFAADLGSGDDPRPEFGFLQMRPLVLWGEAEELDVGDVPSSQVLVRSSKVLGNGAVNGVRDLVVVDKQRFDRIKSREAALLVAQYNGRLQAEGLPYVLIGVGRWGSSDPFLGIPVGWNQIAGARVIVEAGFRDFRVTPSQGTHFFQNLTSCNIGYFTVNAEAGEGFIDWDWLASAPSPDGQDAVRHIRLERPLVIKMNGRRGEGVILKPEAVRSGTDA